MSMGRPLRCLFAAHVCSMGIVPYPPCLSVTHMRHMSTEASLRCLFAVRACPMSIVPRPPYSSVAPMRHMSTETSARCLFDTGVRPMSAEHPPRCLFDTGVCPMSTGPLPRCLFVVCVRPMGIVPRPPYPSVAPMRHMSTEASPRCLFGMRVRPMSTGRPPRCLFVVCVRPMGISPVAVATIEDHIYARIGRGRRRCFTSRRHGGWQTPHADRTANRQTHTLAYNLRCATRRCTSSCSTSLYVVAPHGTVRCALSFTPAVASNDSPSRAAIGTAH